MRLRFSYCRNGERGQTILEMLAVSMWVIFFFGVMFYVSTVFDVGQKQTILLRQQAFLELGNYSFYGAGKHGEDDPKESKSQVIFQLGEKSQNVKVDLEKNKEFKKGVEGDLVLSVTKAVSSRGNISIAVQSEKSDPYWESYQLPKGRTLVQFFSGETDAMFEIGLVTQLGIAHNRSIDLEKKVDAEKYKKQTGLFSGSLHFNRYQDAMKIQTQVEQGMLDNLERVREALRQVVRDDPSLSDEAEDLERSLNAAADSITGGAVAALISIALQVVMAAGMDALKSALSETATEGAKQAASPGSFLENYFKPFTEPFGSAASFANGSYLSSFADAVTAPVRLPTEGIASISSGLSAGTTQGFFEAMKGASMIGQTAQFGMGIAGQYNPTLSMITQGLSMPSAINTGFASAESALTEGNYAGFVQSLPQITGPITSFVSTVAPELGGSLAVVNTVTGIGAVAAGVPGAVGNLASAAGTADTLQAMGGLTSSVGQLSSSVATLAGADPTIGNLLSLAGGGISMAGSKIGTLNELELQGVNLKNPIDVVQKMAEKNVENLKSTLNDFKTDVAAATAEIGRGVDELLGKGQKVQDQGMLASLKELNEKTTGIFADGKFGENASLTNLMKAEGFSTQLEQKLLTEAQLSGASPAELKDIQAKFAQVKDGIAAAQNVKLGIDPAQNGNADAVMKMLAGKNAADSLNLMVQQKFAQNKESQDRIKGMMYGNSHDLLATLLKTYGQDYQSAKAIEKEMNEQNPVGSLLAVVQGNQHTFKTYLKETDKAEALQTLAVYDEIYQYESKKQKSEMDRAVEITMLSEQISTQGPVAGINNDAAQRIKFAAVEGKKILDAALPNVTDEKLKVRMQAQAKKLDLLSNGLDPELANLYGLEKVELKRIAAQEAIVRMREDLDRQNAALQKTQDKLVACLDGQC